MKTMSDRYSAADEESLLWNLLRGAVGFLWFVIRVPIGIVLAFLEPFVRLVLFGIAVGRCDYRVRLRGMPGKSAWRKAWHTLRA